MGKYQVHQNDANAKGLKAFAEAIGLTVIAIGRPVDWLVLGFGLAVACEVKTAKGKLRPDQQTFLKAAGRAGWVLRHEEDVRMLRNELRWMADVLSRTLEPGQRW